MRVVFMGSGEIGLPSLRSLIDRPGCTLVAVVTQPDRPAGRGQRIRESEIKKIAQSSGIPVLQPAKLRTAESVAEVRAYTPDVIVVMAYGQILSREVLQMPVMACLNLHASLLPRHRGAAPIQAAIAAGDAETGITVMHMAEGLDTGDILLEKRLTIAPDETGGSLHDRLADLAPEALWAALELVSAGEAPRVPQDDSLATYAGRLTREDGRIDWARPAIEIARLIRAMNPWPATFADIPLADGKSARLKVFSAIEEQSESAFPGKVLGADDSGILVATGAGALRLQEVQSDGGRRMPAGEWQRGHPVRTC